MEHAKGNQTPAAFAQEQVGAFDLEYKRRPPLVLPPAFQVEKDAAQAAEKIVRSSVLCSGMKEAR